MEDNYTVSIPTLQSLGYSFKFHAIIFVKPSQWLLYVRFLRLKVRLSIFHSKPIHFTILYSLLFQLLSTFFFLLKCLPLWRETMGGGPSHEFPFILFFLLNSLLSFLRDFFLFHLDIFSANFLFSK